MESLYALIVAVLFLLLLASSAYLVALRMDVEDLRQHAQFWRDGYQGMLDENTRVHAAFDAMKDAHSTLQIDYLEQGRELQELKEVLLSDIERAAS